MWIPHSETSRIRLVCEYLGGRLRRIALVFPPQIGYFAPFAPLACTRCGTLTPWPERVEGLFWRVLSTENTVFRENVGPARW